MIDTHLHLWECSRFDYSWIDSGTFLDSDFTPSRVLPAIAEAGVTSAVLVQAGDFVEDTAHLLSLASEWSFVAGVVGWVPLNDPESTHKLLEEYGLGGALKGVRCLTHDYADDEWILQDSVQKGIDVIASAGLTLDLVCVTEKHLQNAEQIARTHANLPIVIDHMAKPDIAHDAWMPWASQIADIAQHDNVHVKLSGLNTASKPGAWNARAWQRYVDHTIDSFGPHRIMLGSDWPVAALDGDYVGVWHAQLETISALSADEHNQITSLTATRFYAL